MYNHKYEITLTNLSTNTTRVLTIIAASVDEAIRLIPNRSLLETYNVSKIY